MQNKRFDEAGEEMNISKNKIIENREDIDINSPNDSIDFILEKIKKFKSHVSSICKDQNQNNSVNAVISIDKVLKLLLKFVKRARLSAINRKILFAAILPIHQNQISLIDKDSQHKYLELKKCVHFFILIYHFLKLDNPQINEDAFINQVKGMCAEETHTKIFRQLKDKFVTLHEYQNNGLFSMKRLKDCKLELKKFRIIMEFHFSGADSQKFINLYDSFFENFKNFELFYQVNNLILNLYKNWDHQISWLFPEEIHEVVSEKTSMSDELFESSFDFLNTFWDIAFLDEHTITTENKNEIFDSLNSIYLFYKFGNKNKAVILQSLQQYADQINKFNQNFKKFDDSDDFNYITNYVFGFPFINFNLKSSLNDLLNERKLFTGKFFNEIYNFFYSFINYVTSIEEYHKDIHLEIYHLIEGYSDMLMKAGLNEDSHLLIKNTKEKINNTDYSGSFYFMNSIKNLIIYSNKALNSLYLKSKSHDFLSRFNTFLKMNYIYYLNHQNKDSQQLFNHFASIFPHITAQDIFEFQNFERDHFSLSENDITETNPVDVINQHFDVIRAKGNRQSYKFFEERQAIFEFEYLYQRFYEEIQNNIDLNSNSANQRSTCFEANEFIVDFHNFFKTFIQYLFDNEFNINSNLDISQIADPLRNFSICLIYEENTTIEADIINERQWKNIMSSFNIIQSHYSHPFQTIEVFFKSAAIKEKDIELEVRPYTTTLDIYNSFICNFTKQCYDSFISNISQMKEIDDTYKIKKIINSLFDGREELSQFSQYISLINTKYFNNTNTVSSSLFQISFFANILISLNNILNIAKRYNLLTAQEENIRENYHLLLTKNWPFETQILNLDEYQGNLSELVETIYSTIIDLLQLEPNYDAIQQCYEGMRNLIVSSIEIKLTDVSSLNTEILSNLEGLISIFQSKDKPDESIYLEILTKSSILRNNFTDLNNIILRDMIFSLCKMMVVIITSINIKSELEKVLQSTSYFGSILNADMSFIKSIKRHHKEEKSEKGDETEDNELIKQDYSDIFSNVKLAFEDSNPIFERMNELLPRDSSEMHSFESGYKAFKSIIKLVNEVEIPNSSEDLEIILKANKSRLENLRYDGEKLLQQIVDYTNENEEQNKKSLKVLESDYNCISQRIEEETNKAQELDEQIASLTKELNNLNNGLGKKESENENPSEEEKHNDNETEKESESYQVINFDFNINISSNENNLPLGKAQIIMSKAHELQKQNDNMKLLLEKIDLAKQLGNESITTDGLDEVLKHLEEKSSLSFLAPKHDSHFDDDDDENEGQANILSTSSINDIINEIQKGPTSTSITTSNHSDLCDRIEMLAYSLINATKQEEGEMSHLQTQLKSVRNAQKDKLIKLKNALRGLKFDND